MFPAASFGQYARVETYLLGGFRAPTDGILNVDPNPPNWLCYDLHAPVGTVLLAIHLCERPMLLARALRVSQTDRNSFTTVSGRYHECDANFADGTDREDTTTADALCHRCDGFIEAHGRAPDAGDAAYLCRDDRPDPARGLAGG